MNTLNPNSDQMSSPSEIQRYFQSDPTFAAVAATYLYFQLLELSQNQQLLEKQYDTLIQQYFNLREAYDALWQIHVATVGKTVKRRQRAEGRGQKGGIWMELGLQANSFPSKEGAETRGNAS